MSAADHFNNQLRYRAVFIRGRVKFGVLRPNRRQVAASHPSALIGWNVAFDECCLNLGCAR